MQKPAAGRKGSPSIKRRNTKRVNKARITADFIRNLPDGITHCPNGEVPMKKESSKDGKKPNIVKVGDFIFDVEVVSKSSLIAMRKFLPSEEYRLLKNRKSARLCRRKRKEERGSIIKTLEQVEDEMGDLRDMVSKLQRKLARSEAKRHKLK